MKRTYILITVAILLIIVAIINLNLKIDNKGHYFGNGIVCGIGLSILISQIARLVTAKRHNK